jgi:hypothetical protein
MAGLLGLRFQWVFNGGNRCCFGARRPSTRQFANYDEQCAQHRYHQLSQGSSRPVLSLQSGLGLETSGTLLLPCFSLLFLRFVAESVV